jgi:hypothetical protein
VTLPPSVDTYSFIVFQCRFWAYFGFFSSYICLKQYKIHLQNLVGENLFIYIKIIIEYLLCTWHHSRHWNYIRLILKGPVESIVLSSSLCLLSLLFSFSIYVNSCISTHLYLLIVLYITPF